MANGDKTINRVINNFCFQTKVLVDGLLNKKESISVKILFVVAIRGMRKFAFEENLRKC